MMSAGVIHVVYAAVLVYKDAQTPSFEHSNALEEGLEEEDEDRDDCDSMPSRMVAVPRLTIGSFPMRVLRKAVLMIEASTHLPIKRVVLLALPFCVLWFLANFLFVRANIAVLCGLCTSSLCVASHRSIADGGPGAHVGGIRHVSRAVHHNLRVCSLVLYTEGAGDTVQGGSGVHVHFRRAVHCPG